MSLHLTFSKMHGLGNDFVIIDTINQAWSELTVSQRQFITDRQRGIGCDQLLLVESATQQNVDFKYRIFNADGGEVSQCGNGARCFARFVFEQGLTTKTEVAVETASGIMTLTLKEDGKVVTVNMGEPRFTPADIPFEQDQQADVYALGLDNGDEIALGALSMGNPHAVSIVDNIEKVDVSMLGSMIECHQRFPERVNAGFMQIITENEIKLRVFERGSGETQACGSGACAAVVSGIQRGLLANEVKVHLTGGDLDIVWQGEQTPVWMTGTATHVFDGEIAWATIGKH
ncbi:MAG: diaminopimelate epimerase [Gammaproteobacteria bacterium]|nr:diaminopimelate epimerase [Gammaproteobacteria bacterium]